MRSITKIIFLSIFLSVANSTLAVEPTPREAWRSSTVKGLPVPPTPYRVELAFPNLKFENPKCVIELPDSNRLLVAHDGSKLVSFPKSNDVASTSLVADLKEIEGANAGPNTVALDPRFLENRFIYVAMGHGEGGWHSRVMRYTLTNDPEPKVIPDSGKLIIRWPAGGHGGGCLDFGTDGYLYISTGDGSGPTPPDRLTTGQDISDLLGAVLRIDVRTEEKPYNVPSDNPFVELKTARPEIWSYGLRNPWKFGIDRETGDIFVADNGWETWEMVHKLHRGSNCGWPIMEGRARLRTEVKQGPTPITPPIKDHPHTEANSVIGGPVYRGQAYPDLHGSFIYGDYITGTVWSLNGNQNGEYDHRTLADSDLHIVAFTEGSKGEVFLLDYDTTGQLYEIVPSDVVDTSANFPRMLSETGLFEDTSKLRPAKGVVPYTIKSEPWMDGARAQRWVAIPGDKMIALDSVEYPEGTVLVKHLSIPSELRGSDLPLETQLLHYENGTWNPHTYLWNEAGRDAMLVEPHGANIEIQLTSDAKSTRTWRAGSTNECRLCHNAGSDFVLGFNARQLDTREQLRDLANQRVLSGQPSYEGNRLVDPRDETAELDDRGRSYLHMNCGICHNRNGPATVSFFAHRDYDFNDLRINKRPGVGNFGIEDAHLVTAGQPAKSIILYRLAKLGYGRMPYIGSRMVDGKGIALIDAWIAAMDSKVTQRPVIADINQAVATTENALSTVIAIHRDGIDRARLDKLLVAASKQHGDIRGIFDHFLPEPSRRRTLGRNPDPQMVLDLDGVRERGELIFLSDTARCKSCHDVREANKSLGPTLADIRKTYERRSEMLGHVLRPSEKVDEKFATWTVILDDGQTHVGMVKTQSDQAVTLQLADKKLVHITRESIEEMSKSTAKSMMPDGVLSDLMAQEAADLLAYLMQRD